MSRTAKKQKVAKDEEEEEERTAAAAAAAAAPRVSLGALLPALVLRRPSASVRTPYVADVLPLEDSATPAAAAAAAAGPFAPGAVLCAHTPAMDAAGLITPGRRVRVAPMPASSTARRCTHSVVFAEDTRADGSGNALVCAQPAAAERLAAAALRAGAIRELGEGVVGVSAQQTVSSVGGGVGDGGGARGGGGGKAAGGSRKGSKAAAAPSPPPPPSSTSTSSSSSSRVDFVLERGDGSVALVEVKIVVCADYPSATGRSPGLVPALAAGGSGGTPSKAKKKQALIGVYTPPPYQAAAAAAGAAAGAAGAAARAGAAAGAAGGAAPPPPYPSRTAIFPHGAVKKDIGVVSDRAIKHLHHLEQLLGAGRASIGGRERRVSAAAVLFVVARSDCAAFRPCHEACPVFARVLRRAQRRGVQVLAYDVEFALGGGGGGGGGGKAGQGNGEASMALRGPLPVLLGLGLGGGEGKDEEDDAALNATVARVLEFNASDPRTHYKKKAKGGGGESGKASAAAKEKKEVKKKVEKERKKKAAGDSDGDSEDESDDDDDDDDDEYRPASGR
jgi:DNA-binding sugar fermentation-stimulating protein